MAKNKKLNNTIRVSRQVAEQFIKLHSDLQGFIRDEIKAELDRRENDEFDNFSEFCIDWVSVKDRLPDKDAPYLVFIPTADDTKSLIHITWYNPNFGWSGLVEYWIDAITHWMPLPDWPEDYRKEMDV